MYPIYRIEYNCKLPSEKYMTHSDFRSVPHFPLENRKSELLHLFAMNIYGIYIIPFQSLALNFVLYTNFVLIRHWNSLDYATRLITFGWSAGIQFFWYFVLHFGGRFYSYSKRNRVSWKFMETKNLQEAKYMSKFRKSTRPLGIGYEGYFIIKPLSVLKFLKGVVRWTIRVLLTIQWYVLLGFRLQRFQQKVAIWFDVSFH